MMRSDERYGVFFRHGDQYLVAVVEGEEEAIEEARRRDEAAFEGATEKHAEEPDEHPEPDLDDFEGMHYVEPISDELADSAGDELARGFAVRVW